MEQTEGKGVNIYTHGEMLGIKNIRLGPTLPAFASPNVLNYLVEQFGTVPIGAPEADLNAMLQKERFRRVTSC